MQSNRRVGIITIHDVPNYGAFLQAWALTKAIRLLGHEVEVVNYRPTAAKEYYSKRNRKSRWRVLRDFADWRFLRYTLRRLPLTVECSREEQLRGVQKELDVVVCGSDQVWNVASFRGFDNNYFLSFVDQERASKVAYAPSCSFLESLEPHTEEVARLLSGFDHLSGRDARTIELVSEAGFPEIGRVVDPTLLVEFDELMAPPRKRKPYLLIYGDVHGANATEISQYAKQQGLNILSVGGLSKIANSSLPFALPNHWLRLFHDAKCIVTSTFHGSIFAMKYRRPFLAIPSRDRQPKVADALSTFGEVDRLIDAQASGVVGPKLELLGIPPSSKSLTQLIDKSHEFLRRAINGPSS